LFHRFYCTVLNNGKGDEAASPRDRVHYVSGLKKKRELKKTCKEIKRRGRKKIK
jgi:hypothetical protein